MTLSRNAKLLLSLIVMAAIIASGLLLDVPALSRGVLEWIAQLGIWGPVLFVATYVLACVFLLPGSLLSLGAGAIFGGLKGTILVSVAATLGAACAFLVGRYVARAWVASKIETKPRFRAIDEAVAHEGWKIVLLTRLSPVLPFNLLNYAFGLTRVRFTDYVLASWIGMLPGTVLYVYLGSLAGDLTKLGSGGHTRTPFEWTLLVIGLLATVVVTVFITRVAKRALNKRIRS